MKQIKAWATTIALIMLFYTSNAQSPEMADMMRSEGKIYVVVGVIVLIFTVLFSYLIYLDWKLRKFENEKKGK